MKLFHIKSVDSMYSKQSVNYSKETKELHPSTSSTTTISNKQQNIVDYDDCKNLK